MAHHNISPAQVEALLDFLSQHENLALGRVRGKEGNLLSNQLWEQCANILNKFPHGANRTPDRWKKYYNHYKSRVKAKVRTIEQGGVAAENLALTPLEHRLCKLVGENIWGLDTPDNPPGCQMVFAIVEPIKLIPSTRMLQANLTPPLKMLPLTSSSNAHAHSNKKNEDTIDEHIVIKTECSDKEAETDIITIKEECDAETSNVDCELAVDHQPQPSKITVTVEDPLLEPIRHHSVRLPGHYQPKTPLSSQPPKKKFRSTSPTEENDLGDINRRLLALEQSRVEADMELARAMNRQSTAIEELLGLAKYFVKIYAENNAQHSSTNNEQVPMQQCQSSEINQQSPKTIEIEGIYKVQSTIKQEME